MTIVEKIQQKLESSAQAMNVSPEERKTIAANLAATLDMTPTAARIVQEQIGKSFTNKDVYFAILREIKSSRQ